MTVCDVRDRQLVVTCMSGGVRAARSAFSTTGAAVVASTFPFPWPVTSHPAWGLYLHVPFCQRRCPYCDFNTYAGQEELYAVYATALARELRAVGEALSRPRVRTLFLGGGTPTVLDPDDLARVLDAVQEAFTLDPDAEITSEANPGTVDQARFQALHGLGVNRLSLGAQSFDAQELRFLGRIHGVGDMYRAVEAARAAGFHNLNLDLIYGLPGQNPATWEESLRRAIALHPEHLSCYALTVEEGTPLAAWVKAGRMPPPDADLQGDLYARAREVLGAAGYEHYEISNWARPGRACAHNLIYWRNEPYLGLGPGAHACDLSRRWWTIRSPREYIRRVEAGESTVDGWETVDADLARAETMMLGLRLVQEGVERARFRERFGEDPLERFGKRIRRLVELGLLTVDEARVRLTPQACAVANRVFVEFV